MKKISILLLLLNLLSVYMLINNEGELTNVKKEREEFSYEISTLKRKIEKIILERNLQINEIRENKIEDINNKDMEISFLKKKIGQLSAISEKNRLLSNENISLKNKNLICKNHINNEEPPENEKISVFNDFDIDKFESDLFELSLGGFSKKTHLFPILSIYSKENGSQVLKDIILDYNSEDSFSKNQALTRLDSDLEETIKGVLFNEKDPAVIETAIHRAEEFDDINGSKVFLIPIENFINSVYDNDIETYEDSFELSLVYLSRHADKQHFKYILRNLESRKIPESLKDYISTFL